MIGEQLKSVVCWMILKVDELMVLGRLSINEVCSSVIKLMKIDTADCVMTLEQHQIWKSLLQFDAGCYTCGSAFQKLDRLRKTNIERFEIFWKKENNEFDLRQSPVIQYRDSLFATYSTEKRKHLPWLISQQIQSIIGSNTDVIEGGVEFAPEPVHTWLYRNLPKSNTLPKSYMIVSNQDVIKARVKLETELVKDWVRRGPITDKFSLLILYQELLQTRTCKNWFMNNLKADKRITMKIEKEADRKGMSEKHFAILAYCDYVNRCKSHHELMIPKEAALSLQRLTQDMSRIVIQRFESYFNDNPNDDSLETSIEMNLQDTSGPVSMKTNGELRKEEYNLFTNSTKCQLCVDRNKAVNWCNTCGKNICDFCKVFHQKVWDVMDHDILPLRIAY